MRPLLRSVTRPRIGRRVRIASCVIACIGACMQVGCEATRSRGESTTRTAHGPLPAYGDVVRGYNARIAGLARLSSPVSVVIERDRDDHSGRTRDQLDGNLSIAPPDCTALRLDKAGVNAAYLGSNHAAYWWFDLSTSEPVATFGSHAKAARDDAADFGLPVHPIEFIELLAVLPLPEAPPPQATVAWSADGARVLLSLPSRWGTRRFTLEPGSWRPVAIDLLDERGELAVGAILSAYAPAYIEGRPGEACQVPGKVELTIPGGGTRVLLVIASPRIPLKINPKAFELSALLDSYGVKKLIDQDARRERRPASQARTP
jgi:hypothetical protein